MAEVIETLRRRSDAGHESLSSSSVLDAAPEGDEGQAQGTYYQGSQHWTSPPPNGLSFVDTPSGQPLTTTSPSSDRITVDLHGNWSTGCGT